MCLLRGGKCEQGFIAVSQGGTLTITLTIQPPEKLCHPENDFSQYYVCSHHSLSYRIGDHIELDAKLTWRQFDVSAGELYKDNFYTLSATYRKNKKVAHRLLLLYDTTDRNLDNWVVDEDERERKTSFEYTFIYKPNNYWSILTGVKFLDEWDDGLGKEALTDREVYIKIERTMNILF